MMMQLSAVLLDSLRLLRSRHLFRISLVLSTIAAAALFATYSFNDKGIRFLWLDTWENPLIREDMPGARSFVAFIFNDVFVKFWLSWGTMILAIVSTASIMPDFLSSGSIELSLARPVGRMRMFAYRVAGAVLFVAVQSIVGVGLAFLIIGLKVGMWMPGTLWAIPLLALQFFYIYSFSALLAVITRSTLATVIGTVIVWFFIFLIQFSSSQLDSTVEQARAVSRQQTAYVERLEREKAAIDPDSPLKLRIKERSIEAAQNRIRDAQGDMDRFGPIAKWLNVAELVVPKTGDIRRMIANNASAPTGSGFFSLLSAGNTDMPMPDGMDREERDIMLAANDEAENALRDINVGVSIGTSLLVTLSLYALAGFLFYRRDF